MTLQRRHFEFIAEAIRGIEDAKAREATAAQFARKLRATNANFDTARFVRACQP